MSAKLVLRYRLLLSMLHTIKNDDFFEIEFLMFFNVVHIVVIISHRIKLKMRLINQ